MKCADSPIDPTASARSSPELRLRHSASSANAANDGALILIRRAQADALVAYAEIEAIFAAYRQIGIPEDGEDGVDAVRRLAFAMLRIGWTVEALNKLGDACSVHEQVNHE